MKNKTLVLDTSAFIGGFDPLSFPDKQYTVDEVKTELNSGSMTWVRFHTAIESGKTIILQPQEQFFQQVLEASKDLGDMRYLSKADMQVLALALELKSEGKTPVVVTDDYSMQNVANKIEIEFTALMTFGIKKRFKWILYCPACYRKYPSDYEFESCEVCGTELKRKPKKKSRLRKTNKNGAGEGI